MESAEAPPVADEARRFRGSAPVGGREQRTGIGWRDGIGRKNDLISFAASGKFLKAKLVQIVRNEHVHHGAVALNAILITVTFQK